MMDETTRRRMVGKIRELERDARAILDDIEEIYGFDVRTQKRDVQARAELHLGAMEDMLYLEPREAADGHRQRSASVRRQTSELLMRMAAMEREERDARRDVEELALRAEQLGAKHALDEVAAERAIIAGVSRIFGDK